MRASARASTGGPPRPSGQYLLQGSNAKPCQIAGRSQRACDAKRALMSARWLANARLGRPSARCQPGSCAVTETPLTQKYPIQPERQVRAKLGTRLSAPTMRSMPTPTTKLLHRQPPGNVNASPDIEPLGHCAWLRPSVEKARDLEARSQEAKNQVRLNTKLPLVPPNPKLFLTATSILTSRAVLAQ